VIEPVREQLAVRVEH
jgi:hypothetical protein